MEAGRKIEDREWRKQAANERISRRASLELKAGDRVRMQSQKSGLWDRCGVISEVRESGRSAYVKCSGSNRLYLRNRIFLKKDTIEEEDEDEEEEENDDSANTVIVYSVHAASTAKPVKSAMKKAGGNEWAGQRRRRHGPTGCESALAWASRARRSRGGRCTGYNTIQRTIQYRVNQCESV